MVTVLRVNGLRVVIYTNDHQPAHVHVFGDGEAKINLVGPGTSPDLVWADRMTRGEVRRAMRMVVEHQAALISVGRTFMAEVTETQIDAAIERGRTARDNEPRAAAARYDPQLQRIVVELTNGSTFTFPPRLVPELHNASEEQLAQVELLGTGSGLHWEALDADLSLPGLLAGLFGTRASMARHAGQVSSSAKAIAARANGAKGGRPRKLA